MKRTGRLCPECTIMRTRSTIFIFKACSNNRGKCTSGSCDGIKYRVRNNECGSLICCAHSDLQLTTPVSVITTTTRKPEGLGNEGKVVFVIQSHG